jgi:hypothetical protein
MRDCIAALNELACETRLLIEPAPHQSLDAAVMLRAQLEFEPDLIFLLSRMRFEMTDRLHPAIPSATWDQDALPWVFADRYRHSFGPNDFLMGIKALDAQAIYDWPAARCRYCDLAASERTYSAEPLPESELAPFRCDVSFVSHASRPPEQEHQHVLAWLPHEHLRAAYAWTVEKMLPDWRAERPAAGALPFPGALHAAIYDAFERLHARRPAPDEFAAVHQAAMRMADRVFRHTTLEWAADWAVRTGRTLHIYGNGWEHHPRLAAHARGPAANGAELRRVYQASAINLQVMGWGFLHQRALDGLCAGGFFLSRRSLWDDWGPRLRTLDHELTSAGVDDYADYQRLSDSAARSGIESALAALGADARWLENSYLPAARREAKHRRYALDVFSRYDEIAFRSRENFEFLAERFITSPDRRRDLNTDFRTVVVRDYSYSGRMSSLLDLVQQGYAAAAGQ